MAVGLRVVPLPENAGQGTPDLGRVEDLLHRRNPRHQVVARVALLFEHRPGLAVDPLVQAGGQIRAHDHVPVDDEVPQLVVCQE